MSDLDLAVQKLLSNDVVAFATETVYGLGARIDSEIAIKKIFMVQLNILDITTNAKRKQLKRPMITEARKIMQRNGD